MKLKSELPKDVRTQSISEWILKMTKHDTVSKNTLRVLSSSLLSIGLVCFCLGFYFKSYTMISLPSFILMILAASIFDY